MLTEFVNSVTLDGIDIATWSLVLCALVCVVIVVSLWCKGTDCDKN